MIFCTAGTQVPFDRFLKILDELAPELNGEELIVQAPKGRYEPEHIKPVQFIPPEEYKRIFSKARLIIGHAGMGTIISALVQNKPIIVFPRIAALGEHRNEHQLATAKALEEFGYVYAARNAEELRNLLHAGELAPLRRLGPYADQSLIEDIEKTIG